MFTPTKVADLHVHVSAPDIDNNLEMLRQLTALGLDSINLAAITYLTHPIDENLRALYCKQVYKDTEISVFGGLYYSPCLNHFGIPFKKQAETLLEMGCDGIKLIENKPNYRRYIGHGLNCKLYDEMFDMLEEKGTPILCHVNDPDLFWYEERILAMPNGRHIIDRGWSYCDDSYLRYEEILDEVIERLERNPRLNIIFAHFMFLSETIERAEELIEKYPNLKFDLTPGWEMYVGFAGNYERWREFFVKYSDRILYGSDNHSAPIGAKVHETLRYAIGGSSELITMPHVAHAKMRGFDLDSEAQDRIAYKNYKALVPTPKPVNVPMLVEEVGKMIALLKANGLEPESVTRLERIRADLTAGA